MVSLGPRLLKVILLGDTGVGKTSIVNRRCFSEFNDRLPMTVGINNLSNVVVVNRKRIKLKIWDTAGQEQYSSLIPMFCRSTEICLLVVDATRDQTLNRLPKWEALLHDSGCHPPVILVVNKVDLRPNIDSEKDPAFEVVFAKYENIMFVSARTGQNINDLFTMAGRLLLENKQHETTKVISPATVEVSDGVAEHKCC